MTRAGRRAQVLEGKAKLLPTTVRMQCLELDYTPVKTFVKATVVEYKLMFARKLNQRAREGVREIAATIQHFHKLLDGHLETLEDVAAQARASRPSAAADLCCPPAPRPFLRFARRSVHLWQDFREKPDLGSVSWWVFWWYFHLTHPFIDLFLAVDRAPGGVAGGAAGEGGRRGAEATSDCRRVRLLAQAPGAEENLFSCRSMMLAR